jgi:hypothetical protein
MNINATIVVQAINFLCVYLILRFFLFKPAVKIIQEYHEECAQTQRSIEHTQVLIEEIQQYDVQAWHVLHTHYNEMKSSVDIQPVVHIHSSRVEYPVVSDDVVAQVASRTTDQLMNILSEK